MINIEVLSNTPDSVSFWHNLNDHFGNIIIAVVTIFAAIFAAIFAIKQSAINERQINVSLAIRYQEHYIKIRQLVMYIEHNIRSELGELKTDVENDFDKHILSELGTIETEATLFNDSELLNIYYEFNNHVMTILNGINQIKACQSINDPANQISVIKTRVRDSFYNIYSYVPPFDNIKLISPPNLGTRILDLYRNRTKYLSLTKQSNLKKKISAKWNYLKNKLAEAKKYYNNLSK